jgi:6-hydroxycyclohex-1-ene-1-carbonyl-CoA dehydrogenase
MSNIPPKIQTWQMIQPWSKDPKTGAVVQGVIEKAEIPVPALQPNEALVEIAGCGVCHTDLGYFFDGVPTVTKPPLTLGHEISGTVVAGDSRFVGKEVIVPAVMPCNKCDICEVSQITFLSPPMTYVSWEIAVISSSLNWRLSLML